MTQFSKHYGYAPNSDEESIIEDAPSWFRLLFDKIILLGFLGTHPDFHLNEFNEALVVLFRLELDEDSDLYSLGYGRNIMYSCVWYKFYDFIELLARHVQTAEVRNSSHDWFSQEEHGFKAFRQRINILFTENKIGWRLSESGLIRRDEVPALEKRVESTQTELTDEFVPAREHYKKAVRYINERPLDPENSIKEIVSALESVGRVLFPDASTLGDVVKHLRKTGDIPQNLVSVIEKFYAYASSEPAVRHGSPVPSKVILDDAEFCLHVGIALIRYMIAYSKRGNM